jgi:hypothetical protein
VLRSGRDNECRLGSDARLLFVHLDNAAPLLDPNELIHIVNFLTDVFPGLQAHHYELMMLAGE